MKKQKFKGTRIILTSFLILLLLMYNRSSDRYSRQFSMDEFRQVYIKGYSGDSSSLHYYYPKSEDTVKLLTKGPVSLKAATYDFDVQYAATDNSTVLKIFASDYISPDNSGGKVFFTQKLDPEKSMVRFDLQLDQPVDSLFITFETLDDNFTIGRITSSSYIYIYIYGYILVYGIYNTCLRYPCVSA